MAGDVIALIKQDHRALENLFKQVEAGKGDRRQLLDEIMTMLTAHSHAEEERVYPRIAAAVPAEKKGVEHGAHEHHEADELLRRAVQRADSADFETRFAEFVETVQHHVEEEESEILPALRDAADAAELEQLGRQFAERRQQELDEIVGAAPAAPTGDDHTLQELREMAKRLGIEGRSKMNKDELARAIQQRP